VIEDGRIASVVSGYVPPQASDQLLTARADVMPGLMDMHTHLMSQHSKDSTPNRFFMDQADYALRSTVYARASSWRDPPVRDLGDNGVNSIALRKAINQGWIPGPRSSLPANRWRRLAVMPIRPTRCAATIAADAGPLERRHLTGRRPPARQSDNGTKDGADLIKLTATGGVLSLAASGNHPQFTDEELQAVRRYRPRLQHDCGPFTRTARRASAGGGGGLDSIVHGTFNDRRDCRAHEARKHLLGRTLVAGEWSPRRPRSRLFPEIVSSKAAAIGPEIRATFCESASVRHQDRVWHRHGCVTSWSERREFELMVAGGMPPMRAIQSQH